MTSNYNELNASYDDSDLDRIAIVGMGLRFPGANCPESFWRNLSLGVESISRFSREELLAEGVPEDTLDDPTYVSAASCLEDIDYFDADLFNIGPREAELMDPQQRLFLTVARETLDDAGLASAQSPGRVAVFAGASISTYLLYNLHALLDRSGADLNLAKLVANDKDYLATLTAHKLDLRGPAVTVQSACSTSLVAVHQACQALLAMECDAALAGGVTVRVPHRVGYSNQGGSMLSGDGHCRAFDTTANGTVPGSGAGAVLLKRLEDARRDGDAIYAVILGSAVNNDGASKIGFTAPSVSGQVDVITAAQAVAGIEPSSVGYIEAHGTGTSLGDPIEIAALKQVFSGVNTKNARCALGSVKTNFGHLECAAGIAGLIKTALTVKHGKIPPSLGFSEANPETGLNDSSPVFVNAELQPWPAYNAPRRAGVSSFGFGGTNCHVVLEQPPQTRVNKEKEVLKPYLLPLSARQGETLAELRGRYLNFLENDAISVAEACSTASIYRGHESHRAMLLGASRQDLLSGLRAWAQGAEHPALVGVQRSTGNPSPRAFLFTGQGAVHPGMGRSLYEADTVFRNAVDLCDKALSTAIDIEIASIISADDNDSQVNELLQQARYAQPALFVLEFALSRLWQSWGIEADFVLGHSLGEYVAAAVAGALSLEDALTLVVERAKLMDTLEIPGAMLVLFAPQTTVATLLKTLPVSAEIAVINGPANVVVAGTELDLATVAELAQTQGIAAEPLATTHGFHSALLEPILDELDQRASQCVLRDPIIPLISTLTGERLSKGDHTAGHWREHSRKPVQFAKGIAALIDAGCKDFIEVGPHPVLSQLGRACADGAPELAWIASLRRGEDAVTQVRRAVGELYLRGTVPNWSALLNDEHTLRRIHIPVMPLYGERHWLDPIQKSFVDNTAPGLLGQALPSAALEAQFQAIFSTSQLPFVADHAIAAGAIFPATAYLDMAFTAMREISTELERSIVLRTVKILQPMMLAEDERQVQTIIRSENKHLVVEIFSRGATQKDWTLHCCMQAETLAGPDMTALLDSDVLRSRCTRKLNSAEFYSELRGRGMNYGPAFQLVTEIVANESVSLAKVRTQQSLGGVIDPALLDACCQAAGVFFFDEPETDNFLPVAIERVQLHAALPAEVNARAELKHVDDSGALLDITACDSSGRILVEVLGMRFQRVSLPVNDRVTPQNSLYKVTWVRTDVPAAKPISGRWLLLAPQASLLESISESLNDSGAEPLIAEFDSNFAERSDKHWAFNPQDPQQVSRLIECASNQALEGIVLISSEGRGEQVMTAALHLSQTLVCTASNASFSIITRNAQRVGAQAAACEPDQALVWGFAAALREEHPELRHRLIDLSVENAREDSDAILSELASDDDEDRIAWRDGTRLVQRLGRRDVPLTEPFRLHPSSTGMLDQMQLKPLVLQALKAGEMLIRVRATGLNFRDVINALGMFPGNAGPLGGECAGVVESVGEGVDSAWIGRRVVCGASGAFSSHIVSDQRLVTAMPEVFSFEEAAVLPIAYVTAHYALSQVAKLRAGERVLIHAGAGGVGQAAIQIAKAHGAEIFTTAGSERKRNFLKAQGIEHIFDSRSLDFAHQIRDITQGQGIDVVLNALSDEFIPQSMALLREGGRFLEIGKLGIWSPERVNAEFPAISYHIIALDRLIEETPDTVQSLMVEVMEAFRNGSWQAPHLRVFDFSDVSEAFRYMQQAQHIGKIALRHAVATPITCRDDGTYLVTGGTGGLGLESARHLAELGARRIVLSSRRTPSVAAQASIADICKGGVDIVCRQADLSESSQVRTLLDDIRNTGQPLRGVIHAAGVLEDSPIRGQSWESFQRVLAPKMLGARILDRETRRDSLDFFVCYSSASGELGAAGQGAYAAANAYLDAIAEQRAMQGYPALSMAWGPWPVGMTSKLTNADHKRMSNMGVATPSCADYLSLMDHCAATGTTRAVAMSVNWPEFLDRQGHAQQRLLDIASEFSTDKKLAVWAESLEALPSAQRRAGLVERIAQQAARALGLSGDALPDRDASLLQLGLDSLMAVELRNAIANAVGQRLPATLLFDYPSVVQLADFVATEIYGWSSGSGESDAEAQRSSPKPDTDISDEAAADIIAAELEKWSQRNA